MTIQKAELERSIVYVYVPESARLTFSLFMDIVTDKLISKITHTANVVIDVDVDDG